MKGVEERGVSGKAVCAAAGAGAASVALVFAVSLIAASSPPPRSELVYSLGNLALFTGYSFIFAFIAFFIGILMVGVPVHRIMRRRGWTGDAPAVLAGSALSVAAAGLITALLGMKIEPLGLLIWAGGPGGVAGLVLKRLAGPRPPPAPPS